MEFRNTVKQTLNMSHFTTINTQMNDTDALRAAASELGLSLLENADARGYVHHSRAKAQEACGVTERVCVSFRLFL